MDTQRGSSAGQVAGVVQTSEQRMPPVESSTQSALVQSASPVHSAPGTPEPRGPSMQETLLPPGSWLTHAWVTGQS